MVPSSKSTAGRAALLISLLGAVILGTGCLYTVIAKSRLVEQNLALAAANAELKETLAVHRNEADSFRAAIERRFSRLEEDGHNKTVADIPI